MKSNIDVNQINIKSVHEIMQGGGSQLWNVSMEVGLHIPNVFPELNNWV
jgi:hypothetical protein